MKRRWMVVAISGVLLMVSGLALVKRYNTHAGPKLLAMNLPAPSEDNRAVAEGKMEWRRPSEPKAELPPPIEIPGEKAAPLPAAAEALPPPDSNPAPAPALALPQAEAVNQEPPPPPIAEKPEPAAPMVLPGQPQPAPAPAPAPSLATRGVPASAEVVTRVEARAADADPVHTVDAFFERNRKEADDSIRALSQEAEALRARLQKVELALGRWKVVAGALNQEAPSAPATEPVDNTPTTLEPIPGQAAPAPRPAERPARSANRVEIPQEPQLEPVPAPSPRPNAGALPRPEIPTLDPGPKPGEPSAPVAPPPEVPKDTGPEKLPEPGAAPPGLPPPPEAPALPLPPPGEKPVPPPGS